MNNGEASWAQQVRIRNNPYKDYSLGDLADELISIRESLNLIEFKLKTTAFDYEDYWSDQFSVELKRLENLADVLNKTYPEALMTTIVDNLLTKIHGRV